MPQATSARKGVVRWNTLRADRYLRGFSVGAIGWSRFHAPPVRRGGRGGRAPRCAPSRCYAFSYILALSRLGEGFQGPCWGGVLPLRRGFVTEVSG